MKTICQFCKPNSWYWSEITCIQIRCLTWENKTTHPIPNRFIMSIKWSQIQYLITKTMSLSAIVRIKRRISTIISFLQTWHVYPTWLMSWLLMTLRRKKPGALCNMRYPSKTHHKLKYREVSFPVAYFGFEILHRAWRYHYRALCNIWKWFNNDIDIMGERNCARFEFNSLVLGDFNETLDFNHWRLMKFPSDDCHWTLLMIKSTLVQVMAWCCQASSHYLSQCWPDLCRHMASLGHNEFTWVSGDIPYCTAPRISAAIILANFFQNIPVTFSFKFQSICKCVFSIQIAAPMSLVGATKHPYIL